MGVLSFLSKKTKTQNKNLVESRSLDISSDWGLVDGRDYSSRNAIITEAWDGEKTPGELGSVIDAVPDHIKLRLRAYDMNLKTDIIKIITGKFFKWVIGKGLKLQAEPNERVLELYGVKENIPEFKKDVEALFNLYANSKYCDYHKRVNLHELARNAFDTAFLGGDALCIVRVDDYGPNIQVVDGQQVETPMDDRGKGKGNVIKKGIELNKKGEHVAFWVCKAKEDGDISHERVEAKNSLGQTMAWMIYSNKARIDHHRGIPYISNILEKVAKLDRFVEASVTKAEQTANVVYAFQHKTGSTGENILTQSLTSKKSTDSLDVDAYEESGKTAAALRQSVSGLVMNLTPDSELKSLSNPNETSFNEFFRAVFVTICASIDIPEEVALQKYEQNYSSSRAAINGWEHIVDIFRDKHVFNFYQKFYQVWLDYQVFNETIKLKNYVKSFNEGKFMAMEAYYSSKFTGKKMPHIDPLKEAKAIRSMLGDNTTALISYEQATEMLGGGDWDANYDKYIEEDKKVINKPEAGQASKSSENESSNTENSGK